MASLSTSTLKIRGLTKIRGDRFTALIDKGSFIGIGDILRLGYIPGVEFRVTYVGEFFLETIPVGEIDLRSRALIFREALYIEEQPLPTISVDEVSISRLRVLLSDGGFDVGIMEDDEVRSIYRECYGSTLTINGVDDGR